MKKLTVILLLAVLVLALAMPAAAKESAVGTTLRLSSMEGTVSVKNASGKAVTAKADMRLYSGYTVSTSAGSYAYISLDGTKVVKLDASSCVSITKSGKKLEVKLSSGNLFFDVTAPLASNESLNIRTSTMLTGIRGTAGEILVTDFYYDFSVCTEERHDAEKFTRYILPENYYVIYGKSLRAFVDVYDDGKVVDSFGNEAFIEAKEAQAFNQSQDKTKLNLRSTEMRLLSGTVTVSNPSNPNGQQTIVHAGERAVLGNFTCDSLTEQAVQTGATLLPAASFNVGDLRAITLEGLSISSATMDKIRKESPELAAQLEKILDNAAQLKQEEQKAAAQNNQIKDADAPAASDNGTVIPVFTNNTHTHNFGAGVVTTPATATQTGVITYTCSGCGETISEAYSLKALGTIAITTPPTKTSYVEGEQFDPTGMVVTATYQDNTYEVVDNWTWAYPTAQQTYLANGDNAITVSYTGDIQVNTEQPVTVRQPVVTFDMSGNTTATPMDPINATYGSGLQIVDATSTSSNFGGWYKDAAFRTPWVIDTDTVTGDMTLYAKWNLKTYTVSFNNDAAVTSPSTMPGNQTVNYGEKVTEPAVPTSTDYNFTGWKVHNGQETALWNFDTTLSDANATDGVLNLFASWELKTYTVRFNNDNADVTGIASMPATQTVNYGNAVTVQGSPTSTNYIFLGWEVRNGQTAADWDLSTTLNDGNTTGGYLDLYAKWSIKKYQVTFAKNPFDENIVVGITGMPSGSSEIIDVNYGSKITLPATSPTSDSHEFVNWGYLSSEQWYDWNPDTVLNADTDTKAFNYQLNGYEGGVILYPKWEIKKFTLTFNANGVNATVPEQVTNIAYGTSFADLQAAYKEQNQNQSGYVAETQQSGVSFDMWYTDSACETEALPANNPLNAVKITDNTTLYAGWKYDVVYDLNAETYDDYGAIEMDEIGTIPVRANHQATTPLAVGTADGSKYFVFDGWYTDPECADQTAWNFDDPVTAPMTLYAKWRPRYILLIQWDQGYDIDYKPINGNQFIAPESEESMDPSVAYVFVGDTITFDVTIYGYYANPVFSPDNDLDEPVPGTLLSQNPNVYRFSYTPSGLVDTIVLTLGNAG